MSSSACSQAAEAILGAFAEIPYPVRAELGRSMVATKGTTHGFLSLLGLYISHYGAHPQDSPLVRRRLTAAIAAEVDGDGVTDILDHLGDTEPWATVARALTFAADGPVTDADRHPHGRTDPRVSA